MHKITKGLKKKKKGKKSNHKEEELFKPEELENYRREHQKTSEEQPAQNEEWKKFLALTSEVDDILKKTQGDLDRIKSTSFFQRKPTESEVKKQEEARIVEERKSEQLASVSTPKDPTPAELGIVEVSESESDEEEDDDLFDTTYLEALEKADVKLAYIPDSPTGKLEGDDPFDTSIAERAILGPEVERKGKKLVPIGAAVEVLTGRVELPTCATKRPVSRRRVLKERDLLLGSFDDGAHLEVGTASAIPEPIQKTLLDEDPISLPEAPIDLNNPIPFPQALPLVGSSDNNANTITVDHSNVIRAFESIADVEDEDDLEFEALAAESLSKAVVAPAQNFSIDTHIIPEEVKWGAFDAEFAESTVDDEDILVDDPFDTAFAENVIPDFILNRDASTDASALANENYPTKIEENLFYTEERITEIELDSIKSSDRDLLGGSNVDLSFCTALPTQTLPVCKFDPFVFESNVELLGDDDFNPRATETSKERSLSRPDVLNISSAKTVSFELLSAEENASNAPNRAIKPLTPFYARKTSIADAPVSDPFDTSFATNLAPGKAELRIIENELFDPNVVKNLELQDKHFNPRDETRAKIDKVIQDLANPRADILSQSIDLLAIDNDIQAKVLTPSDVNGIETELSYSDPFDTSIAKNILPGKTELKLLESELIASPLEQKICDKRVDDLLLQEDHRVIAKPLSPSVSLDFSPVIDDDFDPFDTSCANNIKPGRAELKVIESEFI